MGNSKEIRQMFWVILNCYKHDVFFRAFLLIANSFQILKYKVNHFDVKNEQILTKLSKFWDIFGKKYLKFYLMIFEKSTEVFKYFRLFKNYLNTIQVLKKVLKYST